MPKSRRIISVLLSVLLVLSAATGLGITAGAASGDTIYLDKPDSWGDNVYVYFWDAPSGNPSSLTSIPMTHEGGSVYSYTCKAAFSTLLFNDGKNQTGNLKFPGDGYICNVLTTTTVNEFGNVCYDAEWSKYSPGLSVSAAPGSSDFMNSIDVTLRCSNAASASYSINGAAPVAYTDGTAVTLGADAQIGDVITLTLTATDGTETVEESYTYTKTSSPVASSIVYFDNSGYNWNEVYLYAYGTKENADWPGEKMQKDDKGMYYYTFDSSFANENIIVNNGGEGEAGVQYPENGGLNITAGQCKLLTADNQWVDYGTPDGQPAGFSYAASGTAFDTDTLNVKIGLKNAVSGTYQVDGGTVFPYTGETTVAVGQGVIGNSDITLTLTATSDAGVTTSNSFVFTKTFTKTDTTFSAASDGHTTEAIGGRYRTNPEMQLGKNKTISVDGNPDEWDSSMIIAQGVANDDPRVYMPSAMHEQPWDDYALYAAWDDSNLYFMWEMANTTYITSPSDDFAASNEARPWRNSIPMYLALSINPAISADGKAIGTDKTGNTFTNPFVWGCDGGVAKDGGISFTTHIDTLIAFDSNNSNGGASIFKADTLDETTGKYMFNYDTAIPIGVTSYEKQDNQNGFKIAHGNSTLSDTLFGVNQPKGAHTIGESLSPSSNWVDFFDLGYKDEYGYIYEVGIPLSTLGIDKAYIEKNGIGAMQLLTYGTSGMDCLPFDTTMLDNANVEYSYDPSTSHEKEDVDNITVPLARVGALLSDTVINEAPLEVNFGTDKSGTQGVGTALNLKAEGYNGSGNYSFTYSVDGAALSGTGSTCPWTPTEKKTYTLSVTMTDAATGKTAAASTEINIGDEPVEITTTPAKPTTPTAPITPTQATAPTGDNPTEPVENPTGTTEPGESEPATNPTDTPATTPGETTIATEPPTGATQLGSSEPTEPGTQANPTDNTESTAATDPDSTQSTNPTVTDPTEGTKATQPATSAKPKTVVKKTKKANPMTVSVKTKTVKAKKLKKAKQTVKAITISKAKGTVTAKLIKSGTAKKIYKKVTVKKNGKITLKKGKYKKGTYKIKVKITAKGNSSYKSKSRTVTVRIKVK